MNINVLPYFPQMSHLRPPLSFITRPSHGGWIEGQTPFKGNKTWYYKLEDHISPQTGLLCHNSGTTPTNCEALKGCTKNKCVDCGGYFLLVGVDKQSDSDNDDPAAIVLINNKLFALYDNGDISIDGHRKPLRCHANLPDLVKKWSEDVFHHDNTPINHSAQSLWSNGPSMILSDALSSLIRQ